MVDYIQCNDPNIDIEYLTNVLPEWKTKIISVTSNAAGDMLVKMLVAVKTEEEIKLWLNQFQEKNSTTYSVRSTEKCTGRYVQFKQRLYCHHNTRNSRIYDPSIRNRTKNTNCPSSIKITLRAIKKRFRGKKIGPPNSEMPCEIDLNATHNHTIQTADSLRFRKVSMETKAKLIELYEKGHTPVTALEAIKTDIHSSENNLEMLLSDRKFCPDYNYCYRLYRQEFKNKYEEEEEEPTIIHVIEGDYVDSDTTNIEIINTIEIQTTDEDYLNQGKISIEIQTTDEDYLKQGKMAIEKIAETMNRFLEDSAEDISPILQLFSEKLENIKTKSSFISSLSKFATKYNRKKRLQSSAAQPTITGRRKTNLTGNRNNNLDSRPRNIATKVKKPLNLAKLFDL